MRQEQSNRETSLQVSTRVKQQQSKVSNLISKFLCSFEQVMSEIIIKNHKKFKDQEQEDAL